MKKTEPTSRKRVSLFRLAAIVVQITGLSVITVVLLSGLALIGVLGTLMESLGDSRTVQAWVYDAGWFHFGLGLLALNLLCGMMVRWHQRWNFTGSILVRAGILLVLLGAFMDNIAGFEGRVVLSKGEPPARRLVSEESILMVEHPPTGDVFSKPFTGERVLPWWPQKLSLPNTDTVLIIDRFTRNLLEVLSPEAGRLPFVAPALRGYLEQPDGKRGTAVWMPLGVPVDLKLGEEHFRSAYTLKIIPLPFGLELLKFEIPRVPGSEQPANFISLIRFCESNVNHDVEKQIRMNHPASYPGGWWRSALGLNIKFSQAGWDPANPTQTVLQAVYDPGWGLKWMGGLMVCAGVFVLLYFSPRWRKA